MIGFLSGTPLLLQDRVLIKTGGVGYEVAVSGTTLSQLSLASSVELFIHTHVKEDALELYGFLTVDDRSLFRLLLSVSGVGPKTALGIVSRGPNALRSAVQQADVQFFTAVPRVGKKLAQKIIIELKPKLGSLSELEFDTTVGTAKDAVEALVQLGFDEQKVLRTLRALPPGELPDRADLLIKALLKQLNT